jgi:hypothetical protein
MIDWVLDRRLGIGRTAPKLVESSDPAMFVGRYEGTLQNPTFWSEIERHQREGRPSSIEPLPSPVRFIAPRAFQTIDGPLAGTRGNCSMASVTSRCGCAGMND